MENKICVYAICKNESQFVERWYNSMKEADCIVVLDTGSTDNTVEKLKEVGVNIVESKEIIPWRFDVARNKSLDLIPEEYNILVCTDLDEVFEPGWAKKVKEIWEENTERIEYKYTWSHNADNSDNVTFMYNKIHSRNWIWEAPCHEYLIRKDNGSGIYTIDQAKYLYNEIHLHHYPDNNKSRGSYLELLKLRVEEKPEDNIGKVYLAREYYFHGMYKESISLFSDIINNKEKYNNEIIAYCYYLMGNCYRYLFEENKNNDDLRIKILDSYNNGIKSDYTYIGNYIGKAYFFNIIDMNLLSIKTINEMNKNAYIHNSWLEETSWISDIYNNLAIANNILGNKVEAIGYAALALKYDPNNEMLKYNFDVCLNDSEISHI